MNINSSISLSMENFLKFRFRRQQKDEIAPNDLSAKILDEEQTMMKALI